MVNLNRQSNPMRLESQRNSASFTRSELSFPKRSIPVQVGVRSPILIRFELGSISNLVSSILITFHQIFRENLGKIFILFNPISSIKSIDNHSPSIPFFKHFSINQNKINKSNSGGNSNHVKIRRWVG